MPTGSIASQLSVFSENLKDVIDAFYVGLTLKLSLGISIILEFIVIVDIQLLKTAYTVGQGSPKPLSISGGNVLVCRTFAGTLTYLSLKGCHKLVYYMAFVHAVQR